MADYNETKSSLGERQEDHELIPDAAPNPIEDLNPANDERSLDIGESGQFAPGPLQRTRSDADAPHRLGRTG